MKKLKKSLCILLTFCITATFFPFISASAEVTELTLPNIYMDNMVLQAGKEVKIAGQDTSGSSITATLTAGDNTYTAEATTGSDGNFSVAFAEVFDPGYTEYVLSVTDGVTTKTFSNIVFGDVYLLAGQSNMAWQTAYYLGNTSGDEHAAVQAAIDTADNNYLRFIDLKRDWNTSWAQPQTDIHTNYNWTAVNKTNVNDLSAIGYFYGREMQAEKNYPIGLISTAMNGSQIYYWLPVDGVFMGDYPGFLFNSMINPFRNTNIKGVLWYQGESDSGNPTPYYGKCSHLIDCYKNIFGQDIGFGMVQLTNLDGDYGKGYHYVRQSQFQVFYAHEQEATTAGTQNNVGLISTIDQQYHEPYGNAGLHPEGKMEVAHRLVKWADSAIYGNGQEYTGPVLQNSKIVGNTIELTYAHVGTGLKGKNGATTITGYKVAGLDSVLYDATGVISGTDKVIVTSPVESPNFIQYANDDFNANANLMNSEDFAAYPIDTVNLTGEGTFNPLPTPSPTPTPSPSSNPISSPGPSPSTGPIPGDIYKVGDSFSLYARDIYSYAGKNDPYGYSRAIDIDGSGNEVLYPATDQHYGGGEWEFTDQYGNKGMCNIYSSGIQKLGQGVLYVLNDKAKGFNTKVSVSIMPDWQKASWSAIVTYDGGKTTQPILVYDSKQNTVINGVNYDSWGYTFDRDLGTWPNVESVKLYISDNGWWGPYGIIPYKATFSIDSAIAAPSLGELTAINIIENKIASVDIASESKVCGNLIVATYDGNDKLTGIKIVYVPDANYINGISNISVNLDMPSGSVKAKAMLIDTLGNMKPLLDSLTKSLSN